MSAEGLLDSPRKGGGMTIVVVIFVVAIVLFAIFDVGGNPPSFGGRA